MSEEKRNMRIGLIAERDKIEKDERKKIDSKITENFVSSEMFQNADMIMTYVSYGSETDTLGIIWNAWRKNIKTAFPRCSTKTKGKMYFHFADSLMYFTKSSRGISEPDRSCEMADEKFLRTFEGNIICVVPALAYDETGIRLGYGGGYYDRFIAAHQYINYIGLCREKFILESIPHEEHDMKVNYIITENRIIKCGEG